MSVLYSIFNLFATTGAVEHHRIEFGLLEPVQRRQREWCRPTLRARVIIFLLLEGRTSCAEDIFTLMALFRLVDNFKADTAIEMLISCGIRCNILFVDQ